MRGEGEGGQREKGIGGEEEDEEVMVRISGRMAFTFSAAMKHEVPLAPRHGAGIELSNCALDSN